MTSILTRRTLTKQLKYGTFRPKQGVFLLWTKTWQLESGSKANPFVLALWPLLS